LNLSFLLIYFKAAFLFLILCGCGSLRTEFYRSETRYRYNYACQLYKQGDYRKARHAFEDVLTIDPDYGQAHSAIANIEFVEGNYQQALARYSTATKVAPELERSLRPYIQAAVLKVVRAPLESAGVGMLQVYQLMVAGEITEVENLLSKDFPLHMLAKDTAILTLPQINELCRRVLNEDSLINGSVRYQLFWAYFLFFNHERPDHVIYLIESTVRSAEIYDQVRAYEILGKSRERMGDLNLAVDAYILAFKSGLPSSTANKHLRRIYNDDTVSIALISEEQKEYNHTVLGPSVEFQLPTINYNETIGKIIGAVPMRSAHVKYERAQ